MSTASLCCLLSLLLAPAVNGLPAQVDRSEAERKPAEFEALFDGSSLDGWSNPYEWGEAWVQDGEIHLRSDRKFFLTSDRNFADFELEIEVHLPDGKANSGIMFRCHSRKNNVFGYQAEVDPSGRAWSGGLYDEGRRAWIAPLSGEGKAKQRAAYSHDQWNRYRIVCIGDWIRIWVNGVLTTDERDPLDQAGLIALQHHGEKGKVYRFRNVRLKDLGRHEWRPVFDGTSLDGWGALPGGEWAVEAGAIVGRSTKAEARHGILLSDDSHSDFTVRLEFQSVAGNSGFYFRSERIDGSVGVRGFQAEVEPRVEGTPCLVGGLYETGGRGWVVKPSPDSVKRYYRPGEWNTMTVAAHGKRVVVHVNGSKSAELQADEGRRRGHFGLQLHGGQDMHVKYRKIELLAAVEQ
ncbi:MAG: hypothetical protein ACI835_004099 [Planctomycetota bacterium]|jgi:hypothetical protein